MNISARLVISGIDVAQKEYALSTQPVVIGRENANDLTLKDPEVSRKHARITYQGGRYYIEDLGSTNGTFLNDQPVRVQSPIDHGDVIRLGESILLTYYGLAVENVGETFILEDPQDFIQTPPLVQQGGYQQPAYQQQPYQPPPPQPAFGEPAFAQPIQPANQFQQNQGIAPPAEPAKERSASRMLLGCGCLLILAFIACGASLYLLDSFAPDLLYCGFLQPVVEGLGVASLACP
jgi:predicted component of type VI protein secretion system